jgi:hypothetical protein
MGKEVVYAWVVAYLVACVVELVVVVVLAWVPALVLPWFLTWHAGQLLRKVQESGIGMLVGAQLCQLLLF